MISHISHLLSWIGWEADIAIQQNVVVSIAAQLLMQLLNLILLLQKLLLVMLLLQLLLMLLLLLQLLNLIRQLAALQLVSQQLLCSSVLLLLPRSHLHLLALKLLLRLRQRSLQLLNLLLLLLHHIFCLLELCLSRRSNWQCGGECCKVF